MSWSIEEHIGEGRPWPEQVVVYRGETDESLTYAMRSLSDVNKMVELMDTLAAENAKLRKMFASTISNYVDGYMDDTSARYPCDLCDESSKQQCDYQHDRQCPFYKQLRELGVEVDE